MDVLKWNFKFSENIWIYIRLNTNLKDKYKCRVLEWVSYELKNNGSIMLQHIPIVDTSTNKNIEIE